MIFLFSIALCNWLITCLIQTLSCIASAKLQILKAIHNVFLILCVGFGLYCECKVTNFESNSQRSGRSLAQAAVVLRVQSYKF